MQIGAAPPRCDKRLANTLLWDMFAANQSATGWVQAHAIGKGWKKERNKREAETECNSPCGGDPAKMCGGFKRIEIYTLSCTTAWGWPVVITLLVCFMCYIGGGIGYNVKTKGVPLGLSALPNTEFW